MMFSHANMPLYVKSIASWPASFPLMWKGIGPLVRKRDKREAEGMTLGR